MGIDPHQLQRLPHDGEERGCAIPADRHLPGRAHPALNTGALLKFPSLASQPRDKLAAGRVRGLYDSKDDTEMATLQSESTRLAEASK